MDYANQAPHWIYDALSRHQLSEHTLERELTNSALYGNSFGPSRGFGSAPLPHQSGVAISRRIIEDYLYGRTEDTDR